MADRSGIREFLKKHWQTLLNVYLFVTLGIWVCLRVREAYVAGRLGYIEIAFVAQNAIMVTLILVRRQHLSMDRNVLHQTVAVVAFFSGLALMDTPAAGSRVALGVSRGVIMAANLLGAAALLNLGRSFGILISLRRITTGGVYSVVRHPMYASDILLRIGYIIGNFSPFNMAVVVLSSACYVWRALLEERFLRQEPEYRAYMARVRYRFIPYLF